MSKPFLYLLAFFGVMIIGGFIFFAISSDQIVQNEVVIEMPNDRFE